MINKFGNVSKELEKKCIEEVITRIEEIDEAEVGMIAAQEVIDIVMQNLGPEIYNKGLKDAKKLVDERYFDLEAEIDLLKQQP